MQIYKLVQNYTTSLLILLERTQGRKNIHILALNLKKGCRLSSMHGKIRCV